MDILKEDSHFHSAIMDIATASKDGVIFLDKENQFQKSRTVEAYFRRIILNLLSAVENVSTEILLLASKTNSMIKHLYVLFRYHLKRL